MNTLEDALRQFMDANPDIPEGDDTTVTSDADARTANDIKRSKLQVVTERKGRGGKTVTIVTGFAADCDDESIAMLARELKTQLGTGGSSRGGEILIQGERRQDVITLLRSKGYKI